MKNRVYIFINKNVFFLKFIYLLIILNVISIILESYKEVEVRFHNYFYYFEYFSVFIFTIEYVLRLWTSELYFQSKQIVQSKIRFVTSKLGIIDLISIIPFYLPFFFHFDLRVLRILKLFRLLRIFKLGRLSKSLKTIYIVFKKSKTDLLITFFVAFVLLILSSTIMYYLENEVQPDKFKNIGEALWWAVATLTTVGYGDVYPITGLGKILSAFIALIGIGFVALPTGIISASFIAEIKKDKKKESICEKCGSNF